MIQHIWESCRLPSIKDNATEIYEDNVSDIAQIKGRFIKGDKTKYISTNSSILMTPRKWWN